MLIYSVPLLTLNNELRAPLIIHTIALRSSCHFVHTAGSCILKSEIMIISRKLFGSEASNILELTSVRRLP